MTQVAGAIVGIRKDEGLSKAGNKYTINFVKVEGFDHEINVGFNKEKYTVGQVISIEVGKNTYGDIVPGGAGDVDAPTPAKAGGAKMGGIANARYPVPATDPQNIIINQNSMAHATALATTALAYSEAGMNHDRTIAETAQLLVDTALTIAPQIAGYSSGRRTAEALAELQAEGKVPE
jgi:hypothetical protein